MGKVKSPVQYRDENKDLNLFIIEGSKSLFEWIGRKYLKCQSGRSHNSCKKPDNTVRLYGDYKLSLNKESKLDSRPVPRIEDVATAMSGV